MEYVIGVVIGISVGLFATVIGFDKERSFYSIVLIVIATYYLLFAALAKSTDALLAEAIPVFLFTAAAALGFRRNHWILVAGIAGHGVFDFIHHLIITNPGVPAWWPGFCASADLAIAAYLAALLVVRRTSHAA